MGLNLSGGAERARRSLLRYCSGCHL
jgi:hypothetical protein